MAPRLRITAGTVITSTQKSYHMDRCLIYAMSYLTRSSYVVLLRPYICQSHVIPGFTVMKRDRLLPYVSASSPWMGLGPTRLMVPKRTLKNCGSSSMLVVRRKLPIFVIRGSFSSLCFPLYSDKSYLFSSKICSAFITMERNLNMSNSFPPLPITLRRKITLPLSFRHTRKAMTIKRGDNTSMAMSEKSISTHRFTNSYQIFRFSFDSYRVNRFSGRIYYARFLHSNKHTPNILSYITQIIKQSSLRVYYLFIFSFRL